MKISCHFCVLHIMFIVLLLVWKTAAHFLKVTNNMEGPCVTKTLWTDSRKDAFWLGHTFPIQHSPSSEQLKMKISPFNLCEISRVSKIETFTDRFTKNIPVTSCSVLSPGTEIYVSKSNGNKLGTQILSQNISQESVELSHHHS